MQDEDKTLKNWTSWNENISHPYTHLHQVTTEEEICKVVAQAKKIRVFGSKQSSADIAAGTETLIDIRSYNQILDYDTSNKQITVQAGIQLVDLIEAIEAKNWCIPCLPDINTVTLSGAIATGTHGTSGYLLSQYIAECRIVLADGSIKIIPSKDELINAFRVSFGSLGVFSTITLQCVDKYYLHVKEEPQKDDEWLDNLPQKLKKHDFLRILWLPHTGHGYVITGDKIPEDKNINVKKGPSYLKYRRTCSKLLYKWTNQLPWLTSIANKLLYFAFFRSKKESKGTLYGATVTKSRGSTLELAEWTVALDKFPVLFSELKKEINSWSNKAFVHIPMDVRFVYKDDSWLSYAYQQDTVTVGCVTRNAATADNYEAFHAVERIFLKHGGKPHWGKRFKAKDKELTKLYPKWEEFKTLRKTLDPTNKFLNPYLTCLFNENN